MIELIGKPGCHLCEEALAIIEVVAREEGVNWVEKSILDDLELFEKYAEQIPVTIINGEVHDIWRVDATRLRQAIRSQRSR